MKKLVAVIVSVMMLSGCAGLGSPVPGSLFAEVTTPVTADGAVSSPKVGRSSAQSILGLVAQGDASIQAAMKDGGIQKVHHVDYQVENLLGVIATYTTIVYGE